MVAIFTTVDGITTGENYRLLKILRFLSDYIPLSKDRLNALRASVEKFAKGD
mgnify:CR=1 FL=1